MSAEPRSRAGLRALRKLLKVPDTAPPSGDREIERLQRQLQALRETVIRLKARHRELAERTDRFKRQSEMRSKRVLHPAIVRQVLPHRLVTARARAETPAACLQHDRMYRSSPTYRAAVDA